MQHQSNLTFVCNESRTYSNNIKTAAQNNETLLKAFTFIFIFILKPMKPGTNYFSLQHDQCNLEQFLHIADICLVFYTGRIVKFKILRLLCL